MELTDALFFHFSFHEVLFMNRFFPPILYRIKVAILPDCSFEINILYLCFFLFLFGLMNTLSLRLLDFMILFRDFVCDFAMGFSVSIFFILVLFSFVLGVFVFYFVVWCFQFCLVPIGRCEIYLKWAAGINNFFR